MLTLILRQFPSSSSLVCLVFVADEGQDVVEYGLLIAAVVVVVLLGVMSFGQQILPWFTNLAARITTVGT